MTPDAQLRMQVFQEGQRAYNTAAECPYEDWRAVTWARGRVYAEKHAQAMVADEAQHYASRALPNITHPYGHRTITGPAEDVAFILRHLPDVDA